MGCVRNISKYKNPLGDMMMNEKRCNYYRVQAPWGEEVQYVYDSKTKEYEEWGWNYEKLKVKRYNDETFKKTVKKVLMVSDVPLGTTDLWKKCLLEGLLLQRETFLKRLRKLDDEDICLDVMGSCYTWSIK